MKMLGLVPAATLFAVAASGYTAIACAGPHGGASAFHGISVQVAKANSLTGSRIGTSRNGVTGTGISRKGVTGTGLTGVTGTGLTGVTGTGLNGVTGTGTSR